MPVHGKGKRERENPTKVDAASKATVPSRFFFSFEYLH